MCMCIYIYIYIYIMIIHIQCISLSLARSIRPCIYLLFLPPYLSLHPNPLYQYPSISTVSFYVISTRFYKYVRFEYISIFFLCLSRSTYFKLRLRFCLSNIYLLLIIYLLVLSCSIYKHLIWCVWNIERPTGFSHLSLEGLRCRRAHGDVKASSVGWGYHLRHNLQQPQWRGAGIQ